MIKVIHDNLIVIKNIDLKTFLENIDNPNIEEANDEVVNKRLEEVREMALIAIPDIVGYLESLNLSPKVLIATLEQELEMYVYTHKDDLDKAKEESYTLWKKICIKYYTYRKPFVLEKFSENDLKELVENKEEYLNRIRELELRYKIFSKYSRNLVIKEELKELYECKFHILTCDILINEELNVLKNATFTEQECYQEIVFDLISKIIANQSSYVGKIARLNNIEVSKVIKLILRYLKEDSDKLDFLRILKNNKCLSFLLALFKENGLEEFFNKILEDTLAYDLSFSNFALSDILTWSSSKLSLRTIYQVIDWHIKSGFRQTDYINPLYDLYKLLTSKEKTNDYKLPEGLWSISKPLNIEENEKIKKLLNTIRKETKGKNIILPSTMKQFNGDLFDDSICGITLNEGLEVVEGNGLKEANIESIIIPSSVKTIGYNSLPWKKLRTIIFNNYQNSSVLNSDNNFDIIISGCFKAEYVAEYKENGKLPDEMKYKFYPTFDYLILLGENEELKLNRDDLSCFGKRHWLRDIQISPSSSLLPEERQFVVSHIRKKIKEKLSLEEGSNIGSRTRKN